MNRRDFLRTSTLASSAVMFPAMAPPLAHAEAGSGEAWRVFDVTTRVEILKPAGVTHVWVPTPLLQDTPFQKTLGNKFDAEGGEVKLEADPRYGAGMVAAQWGDGVKPVLVHTARFATRNIAVDTTTPARFEPEDPAVLKRYTQSTEFMRTDGAVKDLSDTVTKGARTDVEKARMAYEWIVENTYRDPKTKGCGGGDVNFMVENKLWGGKCADLNALYVAILRAQGVPARDVYGIRVADSQLGYKSLGKSGDITKAQHCRAEFYSAQHGWVPVDPADVRKVILEEAGGKQPDDPMVLAARKRLFGSWEMNWVGLNYAHDVALPGSTRGKVPFLMYPQSETAEGRLDPLDPDHFKYTITSKEIVLAA
jgi:transglutaminase-like putative cysteine protease